MEYNEIGIAALQNGEYEKAVESFMQGVEKDPENAVGYINLGNVFASLGDAERAEPFFQKAITLDAEAGTAFYGLANLYYNKDRFEEAAKLYEKAIRQGVEEADAYFMLGKSLERSSNEKLALPYLQRATELAPDDLEIRLSYGIVLANLELFKEAGPTGRFTEAALRQVVSAADCVDLPVTDVASAIEAVRTGAADFAVVAIESTVRGGVASGRWTAWRRASPW